MEARVSMEWNLPLWICANPDAPMILRPGPLSAEQLGMQDVEVERVSNKSGTTRTGDVNTALQSAYTNYTL
jgi:hypothetical protein